VTKGKNKKEKDMEKNGLIIIIIRGVRVRPAAIIYRFHCRYTDHQMASNLNDQSK